MKKNSLNSTPRMVQNVFVLLLLAMFALSGTFLVLLGTQVYRDTVNSADERNNDRIMNAVIRNNIWAADGKNRIVVEKPEGTDLTCLCIVDDFGEGEVYLKRLFCTNGYLCESYSSGERTFDASMGETICAMDSFEPKLEGSLLTISLRDAEDRETTMRIALHTGGEAE